MDVQITRNDSDELRGHVERFHYLHKWPDPRSLPFAYHITIDGRKYAPDGRLNGLLVLKKPQHHKQRDLFGYDDLPTSWQVLDLARVWIHPYWQRKEAGHSLCIFSRATSRLWQPTGKGDWRTNRLQLDWLDHHPPVFPALPYHILILLSYCQLAHHDGVGYRAAGFKSIGLSSDGEKEVYVRPFGKPKYIWQPTQLSLFQAQGMMQ